MSIRISRAIVLSVVLSCCSLVTAMDRTTEQFEAYAARRMANVDKDQLAAFVKSVDANGDGEISDEEFSNRVDVYLRLFKDVKPKLGSLKKSHGLPESWLTDFEKARSLSAESGKPIVAMFSASWCGPCKAMIANVFPADESEAALKDFVPVYVDSEKQRELASKNSVRAYPTFICFDVDGVAVEQEVGGGDVEKFTKMLAKFKVAAEASKAE